MMGSKQMREKPNPAVAWPWRNGHVATRRSPVAMALSIIAAVLTAPFLCAQNSTLSPTIVTIANAASNQNGPISTEELVNIIGTALGPASALQCAGSDGSLPTSCGGYTVLVNGEASPISQIQASAITFQVPEDVSGANATVQVTEQVSGQTLQSQAVIVPLAATAPGLYTSVQNGLIFGRFYAASPTAFLWNPNLPLISPSNPAHAGDTIIGLGTGFGPVVPNIPSGELVTETNQLALVTSLTVAGQMASLPYFGFAPGYVGLDEIAFDVPQGVGTGNLPVVVTVGTQSTQSVLVPVALPGVAPTVTATAGVNNTLSFGYDPGVLTPTPASIQVAGSTPGLMFTATAMSSGWLSVTPTAGTAPTTLTVTVNPAGLGTGAYNGMITVSGAGAATGTTIVTVVLNVGTPTITVTAANNPLNFTYQIGGAIPTPQSIQVSGSASGLGFTALATSSGWLMVSPASAAVPATLIVSANPSDLSVGDYSGSLMVAGANGAAGSATIQVSLTITAPSPTVTAVVNAGSYAGGAIAPGEIVAIGGTSIGPAMPAYLTLDQTGKVSPSIGGVQVLFDGIPAPLIYASASQINAVVPYEIAGALGPSVVVEFQEQSSKAYALTLTPTAPGLFTLNASGTGPGAFLNQDYSTNSPRNPAAKGSYVTLYLTGEGQTAPDGVTGAVTVESPTPPLTPQPLLPVTVLINGQAAPTAFFGEAPGIVSGVLQINVQVPLDAKSGDLPIVVSVGDNPSQNGVTLSVR
jgi:uncharacterized protein (TIGR03437 family)